MKLVTKELAKKLPRLYETEHMPFEKVTAYIKLFHPSSDLTWYVTEYDGNDKFYGMVENGSGETEFGYFSLAEMSQPMGPYKLPVERDLYFEPTLLDNIPAYRKRFAD